MVNNETVKYLNIMIESLEKKKGLLQVIMEKTEQQKNCITEGGEYDDVNWPQFGILMNEKDSAIEKIDELDDGFDKVFERVKPELDNNKDAYRDQLKTLQGLITELTDIGVKIETLEARNKANIDRIVSNARLNIGQAKKSIKASTNYIQQMYGGGSMAGDNSFDSKK